jgi:hypothetical protein
VTESEITTRFPYARVIVEHLSCPATLSRFLLASLDMAEPHDHWSREEKRKVYDDYDAAVEALAEMKL